ncbi:MAG: transketolase family protein [Spirochaetaceae bacterium]|jgi:transketolase|nr:transketolase family protein [Spirochaetaceae bacterium]
MAETKEMRAAYVDTLLELGAKNPNIVVLEADLASCTNTGLFKKQFPDRFFNVGIAEANMVGIASGLSAVGKIPFAASFGSFSSRRVYDQFFLSANYARLNVKLVATDPGVTAAFNGGTHMPFEDLALMRVIPKLNIIEPSDPVSCAALIRKAAETYGCFYIRIPRKAVPFIYDTDETFEVGKSKTLKPGKDVLLVTLGALMVGEALKAREILAGKGIDAGVLDVLSLKPFDTAAVITAARKVKAVISAENAQINGGLGAAVAETLIEAGYTGRFARIGIRDEFGEVGTQDYLVKRFGLGAEALAEKAAALLTA